MKQLIIRLDRQVLKMFTIYIKKWNEKHEFKKNRIDFIILLKWINFGAVVVWATLLPSIISFLEGNIFGAGIHLALWSLLIAFDYTRVQHTILSVKPLYDKLFSMRKNPDYYNFYKQMLEELFEKTRRSRMILHGSLFATAVVVGGLLILVTNSGGNYFVASFFFFSFSIGIAEDYIHYVFDFDPPESPQKKAKESLTELAVRAWRELIEGLAPAPNFG